MVQLDYNDLLDIQEKIKVLLNTAIILDTLYKPIDELIEEKKYTINEAINAKTSADKYIKKYAAFNLRNAANKISNIIQTKTK